MAQPERYRIRPIRYKLDTHVQHEYVTTSDLSGTIVYLELLIDLIYGNPSYNSGYVQYHFNGVRGATDIPYATHTTRRLIHSIYSNGRYVKIKRDIDNNSRYIGDR